MGHTKIWNSAISYLMTNGVKNPTPHPEFNILFITNFQIPAKGTVIPDIRKKKISPRNSNSRKSSKWDSWSSQEH